MTNSEQAIREFAEKWGWFVKATSIDMTQFELNKDTEQCLSDLTALIEEHYVKKEEHEKLVNAALQNKPQPTAEDAEAYLRKHPFLLGETEDGKDYLSTDDIELIKQLAPILEEFATLHAQRIAEKMVEERMEQYKAQFKDRPNPLEVNPYDSKGIKRIRNRKIH